MPKPLSFFRLTTPRPAPGEDNPLLELSGEEFDACCVEAHPLFQALVETVNTYSETHPELSLMVCYIAADMLRERLRQAVQEAQADDEDIDGDAHAREEKDGRDGKANRVRDIGELGTRLHDRTSGQ